jgi:thiamine pyrophosphate-dependent acetolactate synthase large subunit-like protein
MRGIELVARILKQEGVTWMSCFPANQLIEVAAKQSIRPIVFRTERAGLHAADGFSRLMDGKQFGVFCMQRGPGAENAFGGVAQAWGDAVPILVLADADVTDRFGVEPRFSAPKNYQYVTKFADAIIRPDRIAPSFRRAFQELRSGRPGPVLLELPRDVMAAEVPEAAERYMPPKAVRTTAAAPDVKAAVKALLGAKRPVIWAGQGVLYAGATKELRELVELTAIPVLTTMPGKSAIDERHPLSLGSANLTAPLPVWKWLRESDMVFAVGSSLTRTGYGITIPDGKVIVHNTTWASDISKDYDVDIPLPGDARLVLQAVIEEAKSVLGGKRRDSAAVAAEIAETRKKWLAEWMPLLTANDSPVNPYRVVWEIEHNLDREKSVVTHDAGHPRDQMMPFYTATSVHSYIGWGKTTHLGYGIGLMIGAKLAMPDRFCMNFMGDAAFGQAGLDIETAVRARIPITTVVINNEGMGGYAQNMPTAFELYGASALSGDYAKVAEGLGAVGIKVDRADGVGPALKRAQKLNAEGQTCLIEVATAMENRMSVYRDGGGGH